MFAFRRSAKIESEDALTLSSMNAFKIPPLRNVGNTRLQNLSATNRSDSESSSSYSDSSSSDAEESVGGSNYDKNERWLAEQKLEEERLEAEKQRLEAEKQRLKKKLDADAELKDLRGAELKEERDELQEMQEAIDRRQEEEHQERKKRAKKQKKEEEEANSDMLHALHAFKAGHLNLIEMINDFLTCMSQNKGPRQLFQEQMQTANIVHKHFKFPNNTDKNDRFLRMLRENVTKEYASESLWILMYAYWYIDMTEQVDAMVFDFIWKMFHVMGDPMFDTIMLAAFKHAHENDSKQYGGWNKLCVSLCDDVNLDRDEHVEKIKRLFFHDKKHDTNDMGFLTPWFTEMSEYSDEIRLNPMFTHYYMPRLQETKLVAQIQQLNELLRARGTVSPDKQPNKALQVQLTFIRDIVLEINEKTHAMAYTMLDIYCTYNYSDPKTTSLVNAIDKKVAEVLPKCN